MSRDGPLARVLGALPEDPTQTRPGQWEAHCPGPRHAKGDRRASLSIGTGRDGRALVDCKTGCTTEQVVAALGLTLADLFEKDTRRYWVKDSIYHVRRDTPNGKDIHWERDGKNGLAGLKLADLPLYAADQLNGTEAPVIVTEGEKAAQALLDAGYVAVGTVTGADKLPSDESLAVLAGREVWLWPDNDDIGREHMRKIAARLSTPPKWIVWPDAPEKGDAADWLAGDHPTGDDLAAWLHDNLPNTAPVRVQGPRIWTAAELTRERFVSPRFAIPGILPAGLSITGGRPKLGKSWLCLGWNLDVAGGTLALRTIETVQGETLYLALEDGPRRIQERLHLLLGDAEPPAGFHVACEWPRTDEGGIDLLADWLAHHRDARLVTIDTFKRIRPKEKGNAARLYDLDYDAMAPLAKLGLEFNICVNTVFHTRKGESTDPLELVSGTLGLSGAADCVLVLRRERGQADASLFVTGRDVEEQDLALRWERDDVLGWRLLGDAAQFRLSKERTDILRIIEIMPGAKPAEIADALGKTRGSVRYLLFRMVQDGEVRARDGAYFPLAPSTTPTTANTHTPSIPLTPPLPVSARSTHSATSGDRSVSGQGTDAGYWA